jgi:thiamine biosynthesis protein ThiS
MTDGTSADVTVTVNGTPMTFPADATMDTLLEQFGRDGRGVAIIVNSEAIPRSAWADTALAPGDQIELLGAVQGG